MACSNCSNGCSNCASSFDFPVGPKGDPGAAGAPAVSASGNPNTEGVIGASNGQVYTDADTGIQYSWNSSTSSWDVIVDSSGDPSSTTGAPGAAGASSFTYIAYATDAAGTGFVLSFPAADSTYVAFLTTTTAIPTPVVSDFTGLFVLFKGEDANAGFPVGSIMFYVGDTRALGAGSPPSKGLLADNISGILGINDLAGWALCTGSAVSGYATPDFRDKFVMSTREASLGQPDSVRTTGGVDNTILVADNLPEHPHPGTFSAGTTDGQGAVTPVTRVFFGKRGTGISSSGTDVLDNLAGVDLGEGFGDIPANAIGNHTHAVTGTVTVSNNVTGNSSFDNRPAFIRAAAIVKLPSA